MITRISDVSSMARTFLAGLFDRVGAGEGSPTFADSIVTSAAILRLCVSRFLPRRLAVMPTQSVIQSNYCTGLSSCFRENSGASQTRLFLRQALRAVAF